jgi:hypothetical protein
MVQSACNMIANDVRSRRPHTLRCLPAPAHAHTRSRDYSRAVGAQHLAEHPRVRGDVHEPARPERAQHARARELERGRALEPQRLRGRPHADERERAGAGERGAEARREERDEEEVPQEVLCRA